MAQYLKPPWMQRNVGDRIAPLFQRSVLSRLSVQGRRTGTWHTTPVAVLEHDGRRYLVSYRGESQWVRNIRASGRGRLLNKGQTEDISVVEVPIAERPPLLELYAEQFGKFPTVGKVLRQLPDPADHPIFRIT
jgi:deazaflavin-dependent oxidoreductase (nitroreductase family)